MRHLCVIGSLCLFAILNTAAAGAQPASTVGVGPRISLVRGDSHADTTATRFQGGALRARLSPKTALEVSLDYRTLLNDTERIRDFPIQGSLLLYPVQATLSPYVLGGIGWYSQRVDTISGDAVAKSETTRTVGYHAGLGGELWLGKHAAVHADYRYTFIRFGEPATGERSAGAVPIPGTSSIQDRLRLSHKGSMWTTGVTLYF